MVRNCFFDIPNSITKDRMFCLIFWLPALGIEPWTFEQKLGEAVFIPAGCPHQVRNLKVWPSFTSVTTKLDLFRSPFEWHQISWLWLMKPSSSVCSPASKLLSILFPRKMLVSVKLTGEFRRLPSFHRAKEDKLEVSTVYFPWSGLRLWLDISDVMPNLETNICSFFRLRRWFFMPWTKL